MVDPKRLDSGPAPEAADRDSQAEALLVEGLDRYFRGRYDEAIHIWTRVLFLDRSHARARAYIDRARTAVAERQRRSDEMLHASDALLNQGQTDAARAMLSQAVATSGDDEHASALRVKLERLERIERVRAADLLPAVPAAGIDAVPGWSWPPRSRLMAGWVLVMVAGALLAVAAWSPTVQDWIGLGSSTALPRQAGVTAKPVVLSSSEVALVRARTLFTAGRLAEALVALDRVSPDSAVRSSADQLREQIQQLLLTSGRDASSVRPPGRVRQ